MNVDRTERGRVYAKIAPLVLDFASITGGLKFHVEQLLHFVGQSVPDVAPDSPGRILRELRLEGRLNYVVLDRRASLYQFRPKATGNKEPKMNSEPIKPADLVEEFVRLRAEKDKFDKMAEAKGAELYGQRMEEIKITLLDILNKLGLDSLAGKTGTAYKTTTVSVTTADMREFRRHVIGGEQWDLVDWRPNKTAINDLVEQNQPLPPGINRSVFQTVAVRKGK